MQRQLNPGDRFIIIGRRNGQPVAIDSTDHKRTADRIAESFRGGGMETEMREVEPGQKSVDVE